MHFMRGFSNLKFKNKTGFSDMSYLYHFLPDPMFGDTLYPLNKLRLVSEDLVKKEQAKYDGREYLMFYGTMFYTFQHLAHS